MIKLIFVYSYARSIFPESAALVGATLNVSLPCLVGVDEDKLDHEAVLVAK